MYLGFVQARFIQQVIKTRKYGAKLPQCRMLFQNQRINKIRGQIGLALAHPIYLIQCIHYLLRPFIYLVSLGNMTSQFLTQHTRSHKNVASSADSLTCFRFLSHFSVNARTPPPPTPRKLGTKLTANIKMRATADFP